MLIDGWLGMLALHGIIDQYDGLVIHFCTFGTFRHFTKVVALFDNLRADFENHPLTYCGPWYITYLDPGTFRTPATMLLSPSMGNAAPLGA